jgi:UDP-2,3-diacylglucosamine hydrolase
MILLISDLHLCAQRPAILQLFIEFLNRQAGRCDALYILGDLFEAWLGDDDDAPDHARVVSALRALRDSGTAIYFMHGNRDFLIGEKFAALSGCRLLPDPSVIDLNGTPTLLMHGDTLCTDDVSYQRFRRLVRNRFSQRLFLGLPLALRRRLARRLRAQSMSRTLEKSPAIMDVNARSVAAVMRRHQVTRLIHGHTHRPAVHDFEIDGRLAQRIVLGDWYAQGSVLRCDASGLRLTTLPLPG